MVDCKNIKFRVNTGAEWRSSGRYKWLYPGPPGGGHRSQSSLSRLRLAEWPVVTCGEQAIKIIAWRRHATIVIARLLCKHAVFLDNAFIRSRQKTAVLPSTATLDRKRRVSERTYDVVFKTEIFKINSQHTHCNEWQYTHYVRVCLFVILLTSRWL